ncbi:aminotransferase [Actinobacillus delphinicola]|uniref:pyridoxal phosphate-dependent aminotransferase n=1 Tax=Actinobacillus delphinicola TaxID=51161 RepID=UPI002441D163|nr:pyridoxal phosphate-dependent aminotransferase [Actinobacillus delphinicola]MDG6897925.1 aminotransferase [Actinobacillus delphinicola]
MKHLQKPQKLANVCYDIRGKVHQEALRLQAQGLDILKLNIGNPASFDFETPAELLPTLLEHLPTAQGYCDSKGILEARQAIVEFYHQKGICDNTVEDVFIGNGVSELIVMTMQALLNQDDEVLIPMPDYPLWTAATHLAGGKAVHYLCDEEANWFPDIADIKRKISPRTKAIVIINPNNPTGAVYSKELLEEIVKVARENNLLILSDEIYDKILYDDQKHCHLAALAPDLLTLTFNGLSKAYRVAGFRQGWVLLNGPKDHAKEFIDSLTILASMRLCANHPMQYAIPVALRGKQSINDFILPNGRLLEQRNKAYELVNSIDGLTCVKPMGAMYMFPKIDVKKFNIHNDEKMAFDLLRQEKVLLVHGTGFNWHKPDHFRIVTLAHTTQLEDALTRLARFLETYRQ